MTADTLFELIKEFSSKCYISTAEMELLKTQSKELELSEEELNILIGEAIAEEKKKQEKFAKEKESARKKEEFYAKIRKQNELKINQPGVINEINQVHEKRKELSEKFDQEHGTYRRNKGGRQIVKYFSLLFVSPFIIIISAYLWWIFSSKESLIKKEITSWLINNASDNTNAFLFETLNLSFYIPRNFFNKKLQEKEITIGYFQKLPIGIVENSSCCGYYFDDEVRHENFMFVDNCQTDECFSWIKINNRLLKLKDCRLDGDIRGVNYCDTNYTIIKENITDNYSEDGMSAPLNKVRLTIIRKMDNKSVSIIIWGYFLPC